MAVTATRNVSQFSTDTSLVRDVSEDMVLLEPDQAPLLVFTNAAKRKLPVSAPKIEWFEDSEVSFWGQVNNGTTDLASNATAIPVADITIFAAGDLVANPVAHTSSAAEEVMLVTAISGSTNGTITVTRNIGSAGAGTVSATGSLRILGPALTEDYSLPTQRYTAKTAKASYCQIFADTIKITRTAAAAQQYGAPRGERDYQQFKMMQRHRNEIEAVGLWGRASESLSAPSSRWTSQGLKSTIATNLTDCSTTFTLTKLNDFAETAFRYNSGKAEKFLVAAPKVISALNYFAQNKLQVQTGETVFGVKISKVMTGHGTFMLASNFRLEVGVSGVLNGGFQDEAYSIDLPSISFRYLANNGINSDTKMYEDVVKDGSPVIVDKIETQAGWQIRHEKRHSRLYNCQAYS